MFRLREERTSNVDGLTFVFDPEAEVSQAIQRGSPTGDYGRLRNLKTLQVAPS
jgi:hypothetical protein